MSSFKLTVEQVQGYDAFQKRIPELEDQMKNKNDGPVKLFVLFTGDKKEDGSSWCPDCVTFDETLRVFQEKENPEGHLFKVLVGTREEWKKPDCPFRTDPKLRIQSIPTIMVWGTQQKLSDPEIQNEQALSLLFED